MAALRRHPDVIRCPRTEVHFFDTSHWGYGVGWYRRWFPYRWDRWRARRQGHAGVTGEKSPFYLGHPEAPARLVQVLPDARLVALLRDPVSRAVSHWKMRSLRGTETRTFPEAVAAELGAAFLEGGEADLSLSPQTQKGRRYEAYLARGIYVDELKRWREFVPETQLLVIQSERFFRDPEPVLAEVSRHVGISTQAGLIEARPMNRNRADREAIDPALLERLRDFYRPHNERLASYLGQPFDWR
ncbi:MAG: hypothetical protein QOH61_2278 [Chloroflexota bacterium]|jgi:hypothetical protein|nr:hypothetical protein [Chloroflexota bacterium]